MENVIFNGTAHRKPVGMAEVKLVLDNQRGFLNLPYSEVEIARRLYRDGTSEYLLNGNECRLKDITDVLHDSGMGPNLYTILELKMVEEILREDGDGRRAMFEEAAGVAKYKIRRRQALQKLRQTEEDLVRLADILTEVERHVASLKRQAIRARKYAELAAQLKGAETASLYRQYVKLREDLEPLRSAAQQSEAASESIKAMLRAEEARLVQLRTAELEADQHAAEQRRTLGGVVQEISTIESLSAAARAREQASRETIERVSREHILLSSKREMLVERRSQIDVDKSRVQAECAERESEVRDASAAFEAEQEKLHTVEMRVQEHDAWMSSARKELADQQRSEAGILSTLASLQGRRDLLAQETVGIGEQTQDLQHKLAGYSASESELDGEISELRGRDAELRQQIEADSVAYERAVETSRKLAALIESAEAKLDLFRTLEQQGPRAEIAHRTLRENPVEGLLDLLGDSFEVDEPYRRAFQSILGPAAYYQLAHSTDSIHAAADTLRREHAGQCTFVSVQEVPHPADSEIELPQGAIGRALTLVKSASAHALMNRLLSRVVLVPDWDTAITLRAWAREHMQTLLSLDGQWIGPDGVYHTGSDDISTPVDLGLARQIQELNAWKTDALHDSERQAANLRHLRVESADREQTLGELTRQMDALLTRAATLRDERVRAEALLHSLSERSASIAMHLKSLLQEIADTEQKSKLTRELVLKAEHAVEGALTIAGDVTAQLNEARKAAGARKDLLHACEKALDAARHKLELTELELDKIGLSIAEIDENLERSAQNATAAEQEILSVTGQLATQETQLLELWKKRDHLTRLIDTASDQVEECRARTVEQDQRLKSLREEHDSDLAFERRVELEIARLTGELDALLTSARNQYELTLDDPEFAATHSEIVAAEVTLETVRELREKIERLGPVNLVAIEEYDQENARLDQMLAQREDLLKAKRTLEETIARINETAQAQFLHTFEAVRAHFQRLFQEFFPDGEADLILTGQDLLDADITLWANPSGKRLKSLMLMSGGEKTMTAIALLFALYQVKPSPFCVFDEVDAPLDDSNIDRFNRVIRMHSENTQFILVTHNRRTMEIADNLYGVTMEEEGVSKLVSVRLISAAREPANS